jgi:RNA polymerase sigma factor (TIGR02999 family)
MLALHRDAATPFKMLEASTESDHSPGTTEALFPVVYQELKRLARAHLRGRDGRETICTTELVHEAFLRLNTRGEVSWDSRAHFFGSASRAMRQILVGFARRRQSAKRSGSRISLAIAESESALELELDQILAVDEALLELDGLNPRLRQIVELRFFGGIAHEEIAKMLGVSVRTVERDWFKARLFLLRELKSTR